MSARARWVLVVVVALGLLGSCWAALAVWAPSLDTGTDVGLASVLLTVALAVLGPWAERARREERRKREAARKVSARADGSPQSLVAGEVSGDIVMAPGAVIYPGRKWSGETLSDSEPVVVGDVPQEPEAFLPRAELIEALATGAGASVVFALTGLRGAGKTQVAAAYARARIAERWRLVGWVDAESPGSVLAGLRAVARGLGLDVAGEDAGVVAPAVRHRLETDGERRLLVFDNAQDLDGLRSLLPAGGRGQVVVTSTRQGAAGLGRAVPVDVFSAEEAAQFLAARTGLVDEAGAAELAGEVGFLPLALAQAAAVIARERLGYATYLKRLRSVPVERYLGRVEGAAYPRGLAQAVLLSLAGAGADDDVGLCAAVMDLVAVLSPAGVPRSIMHTAGRVGALPGVVGAVDEAAVDAALGKLAEGSVLAFNTDGSAVIAHRLLMRVVREWRLADAQFARVVAAAAGVLSRLTDDLARVWENPAEARELAAQIAALGEHAGADLADADAARVLALRVRGLYLLNELGDSPGQVIRLGAPLAADCQRVLGVEHPDTLASRHNLAYAYQAAGRVGDAITLFEQVLADRERVLGVEHPDTLASRHNLAYAYQAAGRVGDAITLFEQVLADRERVLGAGNPDTLASRNNLAYAYQAAGRVGEAITLFEQVLADTERVLGSDHPGTLASRNNLAYAYQAAGRVGDAITLFEQVLADRKRVLGAENPATLASGNNLAGAYESVGRVGEAITLFEQVLADTERVLGAEHPDTLTSGNNLAGAYESVGRVGEAITLYEQVLADRTRVLGADHPGSLTSCNNLAYAYESAGRVGEAITLYEQVLADTERVLGAEHPDTLTSRNNLACAYRATGRMVEAITLFEQALADHVRVLGTENPGTLASVSNLAGAYESAGRAGKAITLYEQVLADRTRVLGVDHPDTLTSYHNLAHAYQATGQAQAAAALYEQVLADTERVLGTDHPLTQRIRKNAAGLVKEIPRTRHSTRQGG